MNWECCPGSPRFFDNFVTKKCIVIAKLGHATSQKIIMAEHEGLNPKKNISDEYQKLPYTTIRR
jgi:hypothetical protein